MCSGEQLWRNWHTRMIQVHVSITLVRVQVPPTASRMKKELPLYDLRTVKRQLLFHEMGSSSGISGRKH